MDGPLCSVHPGDLYARLGTASAPMLLDVRRLDTFESDNKMIVGATRRAPENVEMWSKELPSNRPIVVYGVDRNEEGQSIGTSLRAAGIDAAYLQGGMSGWMDMKLPTRRTLRGRADNRWVTREHPKIDRIACPWLISRFINPGAEFLYVPLHRVTAVAEETGGIPYDIKGAEFGHVGECCSFDAIISVFDIKDPALDQVATIVRGADTSRLDLAPECHGLYAISIGLSANFPDDHEMLKHGLVIYDALYAWCRKVWVAAKEEAAGART
jgi:rhodanese-related sulfurtransferase